MQLNHATQELDGILSNVLSSFDKKKLKGQSKNIGDVVVNVFKQCGNLTVNIAIGAVYGVGTTAFPHVCVPIPAVLQACIQTSD